MVQITSKNIILKFPDGLYETSEVVKVEVYELENDKYDIDLVVKEINEMGDIEEQEMSLPLSFNRDEKNEFLKVFSTVFLFLK